MTPNRVFKRTAESGQVLLIALLVMATVTTVILTTTFSARTNTQTTKLEEENQKTLAAAEAAIQVALKKKGSAPLGSGELSSLNSFSGGATVSAGGNVTSFISPSIEKDGQYTFYLGSFTAGNPPTFGASVADDIRLCFATGGGQPALDIAVIKTNSPKIRRYVVDPQSRLGTGVSTGTAGCTGNPSATTFSSSYVIPGSEIGTDARLMIVRTLYSSSQLLFLHTTGSAFPAQGTYIQSSATSSTSGVTKKIQLFQSYPQIPVEFFSSIM